MFILFLHRWASMETAMEASTPQQPSPPPSNTFPAFPRLPAEIRHEIWRAASAHAGPSPGVCIVEPWYQNKPFVVHQRHNVSLLLTCTEAHAIAKASPPPAPRPYDPAADILYLRDRGAFLGLEFAAKGSHSGPAPYFLPYVAEIRHLAIGRFTMNQLDHRSDAARTVRVLRKLATLEAFSIVYPHAGDVEHWGPGCWALPAYTRDRTIALRRIGDDTLGKARVWRMTREGVKVWERSIREDLAVTRQSFFDAAADREKGWDPGAGRAMLEKLRLRARAWDMRDEAGRGIFAGEE